MALARTGSLACAYLQQGRVIAAVQLIWILPVLVWSDKLLVALGQDPTVARYAAEYNTAAAPFLFFWFYSSGLRRFLSAFLLPSVSLHVSAVVAVLHVLWCTIFVAYLGMGNRGLGLANGVSWLLRAVLLAAYMWRVAPGFGLDRWRVLGVHSEAFQGWGRYMKAALPALVAVCSEWWFWEICALIVGCLGSEALAAHVTANNIMTLVYMFPLGVSSAAAALCGNAVGAQNASLAKESAWLSIATSIALWFALATMVTTFRHELAGLFTRDPAVEPVACTLIMLNIWASGFQDSSSNIFGGICRGIHKLKTASSVFLVSYYCIMLPAALLAAFPLGLGVYGLYYAMIVGTMASCLAFAVVLVRTDWVLVTERTVARVARDAREVAASDCRAAGAEGSQTSLEPPTEAAEA